RLAEDQELLFPFEPERAVERARPLQLTAHRDAIEADALARELGFERRDQSMADALAAMAAIDREQQQLGRDMRLRLGLEQRAREAPAEREAARREQRSDARRQHARFDVRVELADIERPHDEPGDRAVLVGRDKRARRSMIQRGGVKSREK